MIMWWTKRDREPKLKETYYSRNYAKEGGWGKIALTFATIRWNVISSSSILSFPLPHFLSAIYKQQWEWPPRKSKNKNKDQNSNMIISCGYLLGRRDWCIRELLFQPLLWILISSLRTRNPKETPLAISRLPPTWRDWPAKSNKQKAKITCVRVREAKKQWIFEKGN